MLAWMDQLAFVTEEGRTPAVDEYMVQLERFQDAAPFVHFGDDLGSDGVLLSMLIIPHQPLIIDSHAQDEETWYLIYRCAGALEYEVFEPEDVEVKAEAEATNAASYAAAA